MLYVCYFVIKLLQLFRHIYVILYYLLWNVQCVRVCMYVYVCVHVDFLFFLPEMVNKSWIYNAKTLSLSPVIKALLFGWIRQYPTAT